MYICLCERYNTKWNSYNSHKYKNSFETNIGKSNNDNKKRQCNNHYIHQEKNRTCALEQANQDVANSLRGKVGKRNEKINIKVEKSNDKLPNTIFTSMKTPQPPEVTSYSKL